jgi:hypothetical protein
VRTTVTDGEKLSADIEDANFPPSHLHQHALAGRNVIDGCNDVPRHHGSP